MTDPTLLERAERLGAAASYISADRQPHHSSEAALSEVCDILEGGALPRGASEPPYDVVVVVRGGNLQSGTGPTGTRIHVELELEDGGTVGPGELAGPGVLGDLTPLATLPFGIHLLRWSSMSNTAPVSGESTLIVAPQRFPLPERDKPGLALFAPAYSLWSERERLPSYDSIGRLGTELSGTGVDTIVTLPLYAPGLGDDFQASPYSPVSRFPLE